MTRQRAWQLKQQQAGRCILCGKPVFGASKLRCRKHIEDGRKRYRARVGDTPSGNVGKRAGRPRTEDLPLVAMAKISNLQRTLMAMHGVHASARDQLIEQLRACLSRISTLEQFPEEPGGQPMDPQPVYPPSHRITGT